MSWVASLNWHLPFFDAFIFIFQSWYSRTQEVSGARRTSQYFTVSTHFRSWSLFWANLIQSRPFQPVSLRCILFARLRVSKGDCYLRTLRPSVHMEKFDSLLTVFDKFCVGYFPKISRDIQILIKNPSKIRHALYVCLFISVTIPVTSFNSAILFTVVPFC